MTERGLWNERYAEKGTLWGAQPNQFVADRTKDMSPRRILDLGSGQGRNAIWLARQGHRVTAVDISDTATTQASALAAEAEVEVDFVAADLETWVPPAATYDLVVLSYIQAPPEMRRRLHAKAAESLARGGQVLVVAHHAANLEHGIGGPPMAEVLFDEAGLAEDFPGFDIVENNRVLRRVETDHMVGDAIDIVFLATKQ